LVISGLTLLLPLIGSLTTKYLVQDAVTPSWGEENAPKLCHVFPPQGRQRRISGTWIAETTVGNSSLVGDGGLPGAAFKMFIDDWGNHTIQ